ncbi:MAG: hypothetical protein IPH11_19510 [Ignavibacteriales bacterium]|nr:hypothetical protein [Ignavibacteriales bacterium]
MNSKITTYLFYILGITAAIVSTGCYDELVNNPNTNNSPETFVFLYPDSSISGQTSQLTVSWWGDDPDGLIIGYYFKWVGIDSLWTFTTSRDSTFSLPIGTIDTTFDFQVSAVDNYGNGFYDEDIIQNQIDYGAEPYSDSNGNGFYDPNEKYFDIGLIDPTPASTKFPIKNSTPQIFWSDLSFLPDTSFPVMTFGWTASDLDGESSITNINIALNDTNNFISLSGSTRLITLRIVDYNALNPMMEILINGSELNINPDDLPGINLNNDNKIYIQAEDISGAKSAFISLPDSNSTWFVKKPTSEFLIVDNYEVSDLNNDISVKNFYNNAFNQIGSGLLTGKLNTLDIAGSTLPYESVTFPETIKLFNYVFWYSNSKPRMDLLSLTTNKFVDGGGKIAMSLTFEDSTSVFQFDVPTIQGFLPIDSLGQDRPVGFVFSGTVFPSSPNLDYPSLTISSTVSSLRTYYPNPITAQKVYDISASNLNGNIGFKTNDDNLFFIGIPLFQADGGDSNVIPLLEKIFIEDFGLTP